MLPQYRTLSALPQCRNFSSLVLGIIMVLNTQQWISIIFYACTMLDPFHDFHGVGTSPLLFLEWLWYLIHNNGLALSSMLPWCWTLSTFPQCRNLSSCFRIHYGAWYLTTDQNNLLCLELLLFCSRNHYGAWYPTKNQHNILFFDCVGPFPHFHDVGTFVLLF